MNTEELKLNQMLMPSGGSIFAAIRVIEVLENGARFRRVNAYYDGEEFFLRPDMLANSKWVPIPVGSQLPLL